MRLKLFEEFSGRLFTKMSDAEWNEYVQKTVHHHFTDDDFNLDFTPKELDTILNFDFDSYSLKITGPFSLSLDNFPNCKGLDVLNIRTDKRGVSLYSIYKNSDEWYYIQDISNLRGMGGRYKCDSFDGLIQCLNYIVDMKKN